MDELWLVEDEAALSRVLARALGEAGFRVRHFSRAEEALEALSARVPGLLLTDIRLPGRDGLSLLVEARRRAPSLPVIVMSAYADLPETVRAFEAGAFEVLPKPFDLDRAVELARRALTSERGSAAPQPVGELREGLIGESAAMREVFRIIGRVAPTDLTVLLTGETGTGKELAARALHRHSRRAAGPFVALNAAAIPADLLESELFGHEAGAFTGARGRHLGRFEQAHGGTLFLDEIGDMPPPLQTRLLRVLAEGEFYRVGGRELIKVDVRLIAATHQDLDRLVAEGRFRADLLHRLAVVRIHLPPLRERLGDLPRLAGHLLARAARELRLEPKRFSAEALAALAAYHWPGNVRELDNLCRRLAVLAPGAVIEAADLALPRSERGQTASWEQDLAFWARRRLAEGVDGVYREARETLDRVLFEEALGRAGGCRSRAAKLLGLGRNTLGRKLGPRRLRR
ncbi:MAG: nitrogen regulation protein NR(I) [Lysobacterales bacterium]|jgi:two-component system nitrogen regulation response regulator GlnG|nr:MAG: nitrogen regulation protein NR(I) [Xanthomonadales bacterium]